MCVCSRSEVEIKMSSFMNAHLLLAIGWSGGAMALGQLPVPGRPTNLDNSKARTNVLGEYSGLGCLDIFLSVYHFSLHSPSLGDGPIRLKYCLKKPLNPN